jgi:hypothetical protein
VLQAIMGYLWTHKRICGRRSQAQRCMRHWTEAMQTSENAYLLRTWVNRQEEGPELQCPDASSRYLSKGHE